MLYCKKNPIFLAIDDLSSPKPIADSGHKSLISSMNGILNILETIIPTIPVHNGGVDTIYICGFGNLSVLIREDIIKDVKYIIL